MDPDSPFLTDLDFRPDPSPSSLPINIPASFDSYAFDPPASPIYPHTPSYNGSYQNSPYSPHSDLSFNDLASDLGFPDDPLVALPNNDYNPADYDAPSGSLLMFPDQQFIQSLDSNISVSVTPALPDSMNQYYDSHGSPGSSNGAQSDPEGSRRSRASSVASSHRHAPSSPRPDFNFDGLRFEGSPNWQHAHMPPAERQSPPPKGPQSPPSLMIPDTAGGGGGSGLFSPSPPTINVPEGEGGLMPGPSVQIVPATPVSGGGGATQPVPFQTTLQTLHQGTSQTQRNSSSWNQQSAGQQQQRSPFSGQGSQSGFSFPNDSSYSNQQGQSGGDTSYLLPSFGAPRSRSKSDTGARPNWTGTVNMNDVLPDDASLQPQEQHMNRYSDIRPPFATSYTYPDSNPSNFLSPSDAGANLRRVHSVGSGNVRQHRSSRSEDVGRTSSNLLFPPSSQQDFISSQQRYLHPSESGVLPSLSQHHLGHHRRASSGSRERGPNGVPGTWSNHSSARASPYPSPNASPRGAYEPLPNVGPAYPSSNPQQQQHHIVDVSGTADLNNSNNNGIPSSPYAALIDLNVKKPGVTTNATAEASQRRRKAEANFTCPVPGCGSTFTRHFNLKGHLRSHNEEKPFVCKWPGCGKGFARQHDCKRHEQLHLNIRPFTCEGCKKNFARMDALNRHLRSEGGAECQKIQDEIVPDSLGSNSGGEASASGPASASASASRGMKADPDAAWTPSSGGMMM